MNRIEDSPAAAGVIPFSLVSAVVGGIETHRYNEFDQMVTNEHFMAQSILIHDLSKALTTKGYAVTVVAQSRVQTDYLAAYPTESADAYLDVVVANYGYGSGGSGLFTPLLGGKYRLVDAKTNQTIMQNLITYKDTATAYQFSGASAFAKDPQRTVTGLTDELSEVSASVASDLR